MIWFDLTVFPNGFCRISTCKQRQRWVSVYHKPFFIQGCMVKVIEKKWWLPVDNQSYRWTTVQLYWFISDFFFFSLVNGIQIRGRHKTWQISFFGSALWRLWYKYAGMKKMRAHSRWKERKKLPCSFALGLTFEVSSTTPIFFFLLMNIEKLRTHFTGST